MVNITLKQMLEELVQCVLSNKPVPVYYYKRENIETGNDEFVEITSVDLLDSRYRTSDDFSEYEWELENSRIYKEENKLNTIEIIGRMVDDDVADNGVLLAPLSNINKINLSGHNGFVTFGVPPDVATKLASDDGYYIGGLLLVEKSKFEDYKNNNNL